VFIALDDYFETPLLDLNVPEASRKRNMAKAMGRLTSQLGVCSDRWAWYCGIAVLDR